VTASDVNEALAAAEQSALDHMNAEHLDAVAIYAQHYAKARGDGWVLTGFDAEGMDLAAGDESRRVFFPAPLATAQDLRRILVEMARAGRAAQGQQD
jgi:putative heme iron utilization protein